MTLNPMLLIIDDDAAIRRLCSRMLQRLGFDLLEAETAASGRAQFETNADNLSGVFLDLHLPDGSGETLASEFSAATPTLPLVFFTGSAQSEQTTTKDGRVVPYLKKPFTKESLLAVLGKAGVALP